MLRIYRLLRDSGSLWENFSDIKFNRERKSKTGTKYLSSSPVACAYPFPLSSSLLKEIYWLYDFFDAWLDLWLSQINLVSYQNAS